MSPLLRRLLLAALLQLAPAQAPDTQPEAPGHQKKGNSDDSDLVTANTKRACHLPRLQVSIMLCNQSQLPLVSWIDVYTRATCQPREVVVPLTMELVGTMAKQLVPSCVTVHRCGGCCPDDGLECVPIGQHEVRMQILMIRYPSSQLGEMSLEEHSQCECRPKKKESAVKPERASTPHHRPQPRSVPGWDSIPRAPSPADITHPTPAPGPSAHPAPSAASALTPGPAAATADAAASSVAKGGA
ncbi:vascular endothelial growth factor B isoform X1 [Choloepus didactylus]|uniref:vascular endothelial growth factor B isoform X1 n=1 Tax=Choloepus didactylus TaxID=27675 RepID=UPI00189C7012|nr:vascular endothelial growth factor B isoform X1 [Choloepus didactylus]